MEELTEYIVKWKYPEDFDWEIVCTTYDKKIAFSFAMQKLPYRKEAIVLENGVEIYRGMRA